MNSIKEDFEKEFFSKHGSIKTFADEHRRNWAFWGFLQGLNKAANEAKYCCKLDIEKIIKELEEAP